MFNNSVQRAYLSTIMISRHCHFEARHRPDAPEIRINKNYLPSCQIYVNEEMMVSASSSWVGQGGR